MFDAFQDTNLDNLDNHNDNLINCDNHNDNLIERERDKYIDI